MEFTSLINLYLTQHFKYASEEFIKNPSTYIDVLICKEVSYIFNISLEEAIDYFCNWCETSEGNYLVVLNGNKLLRDKDVDDFYYSNFV